jgi:uncharacterized membrane protein YccC
MTRDYATAFRKFLTSQYLHTGFRLTAAVIIPALILFHFNVLGKFMSVPLGALLVGLTDGPGTFRHRRNTMVASIIINFIIIVISGFINGIVPLTIIGIIVFGIFFSLISVYGTRIGSIGSMAILVYVFNIDGHVSTQNFIYGGLLFSAGGLFYLLLSLFLYTLRPYKLIQQMLGECIMETAAYLKVKAAFYGTSPDYAMLQDKLLEYQISIQKHHTDLREMLFKTRSIINESIRKGRVLMQAFLDAIELFERVATSQQDYVHIHENFDGSNILEQYAELINELANQLTIIGLAFQEGTPANNDYDVDAHLQKLTENFRQLRSRKLTPETLQYFIMLRQILYSLEDLGERVKRLRLYTSYDVKLKKRGKANDTLDLFVNHQELNVNILISNFSLSSEQFRHAIRLTVALLAGYIISLFLSIGHSYWILLTISVIIKPSYSITRERNIKRLSGTITGGIAGFVMIHFIHNETALFFIMLVAMILAYSFLKLNYFISSAGITLYVIFSISFLAPSSIASTVTDRLLDTAIGSLIAFIASIFVLPLWGYKQLSDYIIKMLESNHDYFMQVAAHFANNKPLDTSYKLARKAAFVSLANMSDHFQRILSEPKSKRMHLESYHQFVATSHTLSSYIASLAYYAHETGEKFVSKDFEDTIYRIDETFKACKEIAIQHNDAALPDVAAITVIHERVTHLIEQRKMELSGQHDESEMTVRTTLSYLRAIDSQFQLIQNIVMEQVKILKEIYLQTNA